MQNKQAHGQPITKLKAPYFLFREYLLTMSKTICFDIDGTICTNTEGAYESAQPFMDVVAEINRFYDEGYKIILNTARGSTTGIDWREVTEGQMKAWGVKYHELYLGKPTADIYIDDKTINAHSWRGSKFVETLQQAQQAPKPAEQIDGRKVYMNGVIVPENEAKISIYDSALMFGDMVFEMTRSFNKKQFKLRQHLERLYSGLKILRIPLAMTIEEMERAVYQTIEANEDQMRDDDEHRIMIDVSRGLLGIYQDVEGLHKGPNVIIADFPLRWTVAGMGKLFDGGVNAVIPAQRAIPGNLLDPKIKNRSRIHYLMANIQTSNHEGENNFALLLDPDGHVTEGTGDNFFIIKDKKIISPEGRNILRGISRAYVMEELAAKLGLEVIEKNFEPYDVHNADEAFMTGTPFCMLPVTSLDGLQIGSGEVGPVFKDILRTWSETVDLDIEGQIKAWDENRAESSSDAPTPYKFKPKK